jgi:hypothetical protein
MPLQMQPFYTVLKECRNTSIQQIHQTSFDTLNAFFSNLSFPVETVKEELCRIASTHIPMKTIRAYYKVDITPLTILDPPLVFYVKEKDADTISRIDFTPSYLLQNGCDEYLRFQPFFLKDTYCKEIKRIQEECQAAFSDGTIRWYVYTNRTSKLSELVFEVTYILDLKNTTCLDLCL